MFLSRKQETGLLHLLCTESEGRRDASLRYGGAGLLPE